MGDKARARRTARDAGVPVVPGSDGRISAATDVIAFGAEHGWPVAVKAAFGGGGRGMKVIGAADDAAAAVDAARREAVAYFGRPDLYVERFLSWPRHVEMQVLADGHGNIVWLGERDCSVQRRHQKLIEETPAPDFPEDVRRDMGEAAVRLARSCSYAGAGTVEFLYQDGAFYFLEMNTRIQVEHPVTELVTGIDLVAWQLRVAAGERLGFRQEDIRTSGHAIEARINAEDPAGGAFLPSPGTLAAFDLPGGPGVRVDAGYAAGDAVTPYYDNLVAKIAVWAADRDAARRRMLRALRETRIAGIATTIPAHEAVLRHPDFVAVRHSTNWLEERLEMPSSAMPPPSAAPARRGSPATASPATPSPSAAASASTAPWRSRRGVPAVTTWRAGAAGAPLGVAPVGAKARPDVAGAVLAPMQGTVIRLLASVGAAVTAEVGVCIVEAMKMENLVRAGTAGVVTRFLVAEGDQVEAGSVIATVSQEPV